MIFHCPDKARRAAESFYVGEVVPVLRRLDKRRRKLAAVEVQRILFYVQFNFSHGNERC